MLHSLEDYKTNKKEIGKVDKIRSKLKKLETLEDKKRQAQEQYLNAQANYYYYTHHQLEKEIAQTSIALDQAKWKRLMVEQLTAD